MHPALHAFVFTSVSFLYKNQLSWIEGQLKYENGLGISAATLQKTLL